MDVDYESRRFVCETCKKRFSRKQLLTRHLASHSDERPFQCEVCPKNYKYTKNLIRHTKVKHFSEWLYWKKARNSQKCKNEDEDVGKFLTFGNSEKSKTKESDREEGMQPRTRTIQEIFRARKLSKRLCQRHESQ
ncbi:unnamed protein product [Blepharisma stoltei]|uniref:C2H2-type domain-containing protein n=1 Tax=Blepharisma stoltei TaxID=1481888 RepID=A0AAU9K9M0_9CILI|nr:unnamed protein product [Blepharisma stoltei]